MPSAYIQFPASRVMRILADENVSRLVVGLLRAAERSA